ncbi:unnamed protein product, partial [marine sediment metagenome]
GEEEQPLERSTYNVPVYVEQGGAKLVVETGGEIELQSGATLDVQAGVTTDFSSGIDLDGSTLIIDADGDSTLTDSTDDLLLITLGSGTGTLSVITGSFKVGNGAPDTAQDGEDAYVEGTFEVDGNSLFDSQVDINGNSLIIDADGDSTLADSTDDLILLTLGSATGTMSILTGNFKVGNGAEDVTLGGEDAYVEGTFEVDGTSLFDSNVDINGNSLIIDADGDSTLADTTDDLVLLTLGSATGTMSVVVGSFKVGDQA